MGGRQGKTPGVPTEAGQGRPNERVMSWVDRTGVDAAFGAAWGSAGAGPGTVTGAGGGDGGEGRGWTDTGVIVSLSLSSACVETTGTGTAISSTTSSELSLPKLSAGKLLFFTSLLPVLPVLSLTFPQTLGLSPRPLSDQDLNRSLALTLVLSCTGTTGASASGAASTTWTPAAGAVRAWAVPIVSLRAIFFALFKAVEKKDDPAIVVSVRLGTWVG